MLRLGLEQLSVFGLPPVAFVNLAADLGCECISTALTAMPYNPHGYPAFSLREDAALRREMIAALRDRGVAISLGEGCNIRPNQSVSDMARDLDLFHELVTERINMVSLDSDLERSLDQFAQLASMAAERGMDSTLELCPALIIGDLAAALAAVRHVGRPDFRLLVDTMHFARSGATAADIAALDPALIGYVQLSDAPLRPRIESYMQEATFERMAPGEGELPLREMLAALPEDIVVSLEVPMRKEAEAGIGPEIRLRRCLEATRALLAA